LFFCSIAFALSGQSINLPIRPFAFFLICIGIDLLPFFDTTILMCNCTKAYHSISIFEIFRFPKKLFQRSDIYFSGANKSLFFHIYIMFLMGGCLCPTLSDLFDIQRIKLARNFAA